MCRPPTVEYVDGSGVGEVGILKGEPLGSRGALFFVVDFAFLESVPRAFKSLSSEGVLLDPSRLELLRSADVATDDVDVVWGGVLGTGEGTRLVPKLRTALAFSSYSNSSPSSEFESGSATAFRLSAFDVATTSGELEMARGGAFDFLRVLTANVSFSTMHAVGENTYCAWLAMSTASVVETEGDCTQWWTFKLDGGRYGLVCCARRSREKHAPVLGRARRAWRRSGLFLLDHVDLLLLVLSPWTWSRTQQPCRRRIQSGTRTGDSDRPWTRRSGSVGKIALRGQRQS